MGTNTKMVQHDLRCICCSLTHCMEAIARRVLSCVVVRSRSWSPYTEERCGLLLSLHFLCESAATRIWELCSGPRDNLGNLTFEQ